MLSLNPYIAGNPVGGTPNFVGRADVLREVLRVMRQPHQNIIVLYGQRRIGKTSVLQQLAAQLPNEGNYYPVYFDLQDKATWSLGRVLTDLARALSYELVRQGPPSMKQTGPLLSDVDPVKAFQETWLPATLNRLPEGHSIVLLFDEFDVLADPKGGQAGADLFPYLRGLLATDPDRLQFAFVIGRKVEDLESIALSLFKGAPSLRVSLLNKADTIELMRLSERNESLKWSSEAADKVWDLTHGHPFLTQQLCSRLWENLYDSDPTGTPTVIPEDVEKAISETLEASRNTLEWLWDGLPPAERVVISALAGAGDRPITQPQLEQLLRESGVRVVIRELQNAPQLLRDWDLIEPAEDGYRFRVELFRRWILEHKPLSRVQEELDRIEPLAENLYQAAYGFFRSNQLEDAMPLLRQAIGLNPNHARSRQLLAEIFLLRGEVDQAVQILQLLYDTQPSIARPRLVQALLLKTEEEPDEEKRLAIYQQILMVDPAHPLVTPRVAEIQKTARQHELAEQLTDLRALEAEKRYREALEVARKLSETYPDDRDWPPDLDRLERKTKLADDYQRAIGALNSGDKETALRGLADVIALEPDYEEATRYLHLAKTGQDATQLASQLSGEQKSSSRVKAKLDEETFARTEVEKQRSELQIRLENEKEHSVSRQRMARRMAYWSLGSSFLAVAFFIAWFWRGVINENNLTAATQTALAQVQSELTQAASITPEVPTETPSVSLTEISTELVTESPPLTEDVPVITPTTELTEIPTPEITPTTNPFAGPVPAGALARLGKGQISEIALSPQGDLFAVAASTGVYLYRADTSDTFETVWEAPTEAWVLSVAFNQKGDVLASGLSDNTILLWSVETGALSDTLFGAESGVTSLAFSVGDNQLASGDNDGRILLWDLTSEEKSTTPLIEHTGKITGLAYYPNGGFLASGSIDGTVRLWELFESGASNVLLTHAEPVTRIAFSHDSLYLASASQDDLVRLWSFAEDAELPALEGHGSDVTSLAFSPDNTLLASGSADERIILWRVDTWDLLDELSGTGGVSDLAFGPDNHLYSVLADSHVVALDIDGTPLQTLIGHTSRVSSLAYSPNGVLAAAYGNTIVLWDSNTGEKLDTLVRHTGEITSLAFSHSGNLLASGSRDTTIILWDMNFVAQPRTLKGHKDTVLSVAFDPNDLILASGSEDTDIILWHTDSDDWSPLTGHESAVYSVAYSLNGDLASGSEGGNVFLWDLTNRFPLPNWGEDKRHDGTVFSLDFSPDGSQLASGSFDNQILLWDVGSGDYLGVVGELSTSVWALAFSPVSNWLASGSLDGSVILWPLNDLASETSQIPLPGHTADVTAVAFSAHGQILASASSDGTIILWDIPNILP